MMRLLSSFTCNRFNTIIIKRLYSSAKQLIEPNDPKLIRNIGIIAHIDAGKTTTTERMLYYSGFLNVMGEVHDGDTVMDYMSQERERGITITSASITFPWKKHRINLIDTPGHVDFTFEVERSLSVLDGAVTILDASAGVEAQTYTVWSQSYRHNIPRIIYLNKMDKSSANLSLSINSIKQKLGVLPLLIHVPIFKNDKFCGIADVIAMEKYIWSNDVNDDGTNYQTNRIDTNDGKLYESVCKTREDLIGAATELDEKFAEIVISCENLETIPIQYINNAVRGITIKQLGFPVLCGSSYKNIGVQLLLDSIIRYLPSPLEKPRDLINYYRSELCAFAFKTIHHKRLGPLTFLRIYSGELKHQSIYNINRDTNEKISKLYVAFADDFKEMPKVSHGNIAVVSGLESTITGDTLISSSVIAHRVREAYAKDNSIPIGDSRSILAGITVPEPVFFCSIEAPSLSKQKQLEIALENLQREDPTFKVSNDNESGQIIIKGMGELHIEVIKDRILREYDVDTSLGELQVSYRESIQKSVEDTLDISKTIAGNKNYVKITLSLQPKPGFGTLKKIRVVVNNENDLGKLRSDYLKAIESGVMLALDHGPILSFPIIDVSVNLLWFEARRGTSYSFISSAASQCVANLIKNAAPYLLEPSMRLEITVPEHYVGRVLSDLSGRRSQIGNMQMRGDYCVLNAITPLSELFNYSTILRTLTSGTSNFSMQFDSYQNMNENDQNKAIQHVTGFAPV